MPKIQEYLIISQPTKWQFEGEVNENIDLGWQPYGEFFFHKWPDKEKGYKEEYIQAMVIYGDDQ